MQIKLTSANIILGTLLLFSVAPKVLGGQEVKSSGQQFEYKVVDPDDKGGDSERRQRLEAQLKPLGEQGWELVEMPYLKGVRYQVAVLKRPMPPK